LYYDYETGQQYYMGIPGVDPNDKAGGLRRLGNVLGMASRGELDYTKNPTTRIYVNGANSTPTQVTPKHNYIDIAALYPELMQGAQGMQGDYQAGNLLGGAAQSASSGAGRFL
jgi:hypothetical protein